MACSQRQKDGTPPGGLSPEKEDNLARSNKKAKVQEVVEVSQEDTVVMETPMDIVDANHEGSPQQDKQRNVGESDESISSDEEVDGEKSADQEDPYVRWLGLLQRSYNKLEGPWMIMGHYLVLQRWQPNFFPFQDELKRVAVWIRVPGLPMEYYDRNILWRIGDTLGKTVKIDSNTLKPKDGCWGQSTTEMGKFARLCIEVDLRKVLITKFELHGRNYSVEYEGLYLVCFGCGRYAHRKDSCPLQQAGDGDLNQPKECAENITPADDGGKSHKDVQGRGRVVYGEEGTNDAFGPWMLVQKPVRKRQNSTKKPISVTAKDTCGTNMVVANDRQSYGSRFDALAQNMDVEEEVQHVEHPMSVTIHQQKDPSNRAAPIEGPKTMTQIKNKARSSAPEKSQNGPQFTSPNQHKEKPTQSFNFHQNPKPMEIIPSAMVVLNKDSHGLFVSNVPSTSDPHKMGPGLSQSSMAIWDPWVQCLLRGLSALMDDNGNLVSDPADLRNVAVSFFRSLYSEDSVPLPWNFPNGFPQILPLDHQELEARFSEIEIRDSSDSWLRSGTKLIDVAVSAIPINLLYLSVKDYVDEYGCWKIYMFSSLIPQWALDEIHGTLPPRADLGPDTISWSLSSNGLFTTKSAYYLVADNPHGPNHRIWKAISDDHLCPICKSIPESSLHALRDCSRAQAVWMFLGVGDLNSVFYSMDLFDWIYSNVTNSDISSSTVPWNLLFVVTLSSLWYSRNDVVFNNKIMTVNDILVVAKFRALEFHQTLSPARRALLPSVTRNHYCVRWVFPIGNWIKCNVDGSVKELGQRAACCGVFRNAQGVWIKGFVRNIGLASITMT
ncbi:hypothetical protein SESBI_08631 [Sesbania bispinosa]|nr:hypothetical protein SESBI_08631 [Sesbania bispinosa]